MHRMLIDGKLVTADRTYPSVNPATGQVLDQAPAASVDDARAAIAAARRAFDTTGWATDAAFRARCLDQLHRALLEHKEELRELTIADVGAPRVLTHGPQLEEAIEIVRYYADLLPGYPMTQELGLTEFRGQQHRRWEERDPAGVVAAIIGYNYPTQLALAKLSPALAAGCTVVLKGAPDTPLITLALGELVRERADDPGGVGAGPASDHTRARRADRRAHRHPGRRGQRPSLHGCGRGRGAHHLARRRRGHVHRLHRDRPPDHGGGELGRQARLPRARRQVRPCRARRRRPRRADRHRGVRDLLARGAGLRDPDPDAGAARAARRDRCAGRGRDGPCDVRRPVRQ